MVRIIGLLVLFAGWAWGKDAVPDPKAALEDFAKYQQVVYDTALATKYAGKIEKDIGKPSIGSAGRYGKLGAVLVFVYFERAYYQPNLPSYAEMNEALLNFVRQGDFLKHLYQFSDLHPDQARQSAWEMTIDNRTVRVEITPNNAVVATFYTQGDFRVAMNAQRAALPLPIRRQR